MSKQEALFQSLATAGTVLITFIGIVHEFIGATLFPWGPALLGGPIVWHGLGIGSTMIGLLMTAGVLQIIKFPVIMCSVVIAAAGLSIMLLTAVLHREFHLFALTICLAAITTGGCYRRMKQLLSIATAVLLLSTQLPAIAESQSAESVNAFRGFRAQSLQKRSTTRQDVDISDDRASSFWDEHAQGDQSNPDHDKPLVSLDDRNQALYGPDTARNLERFRQEIENFKRLDAKNTAPTNAILFVGSSSIVHWKTAAAFPSYPVINRGFGGSTLVEINYFYDDVVKRYKPAVIVLYCDNDIYEGDAPSVALQRFQEFSTRVARDFPNTKILFMSMKPTPTDAMYGEHVRDNETIANRMIKSFIEAQRNMRYVDVASAMFHKERLRSDIFLPDGMHLNEQGYDIWNPIVAKQLAKLYATPVGHRRR